MRHAEAINAANITTRACHLNATFFGVPLNAPDNVKQACANRG